MRIPASRGSSACPRVRLVASLLCAWLVMQATVLGAASKRPPAPPGRVRVGIFAVKGDPNTPDEGKGLGRRTWSTNAALAEGAATFPDEWMALWSWLSR